MSNLGFESLFPSFSGGASHGAARISGRIGPDAGPAEAGPEPPQGSANSAGSPEKPAVTAAS